MRNLRSAGTTSLLAVALLVLPFGAASPASAAEEEAAIDSASVIGQLEGIRGELKAIAKTLGAVEEHYRVAALMTRIQLKQERLSSIEGELRSARGEQEAAEQEIARLTGVEEAVSREDVAEQDRVGLEIMRQEKKNLEARVETLRLRIVELENDLGRSQEDILTLEETVDSELGLR